MLRNLLDYAMQFYIKYGQPIHVNNKFLEKKKMRNQLIIDDYIQVMYLAGGCREANSTSYEGEAFDVSCRFPRWVNDLIKSIRFKLFGF